jgi:hypothetical protein
MKTVALNIMAAVLFAVALTSCGKGGGDVKLLESITDDSGKVQKKFEYDEQNRIVKVYKYDEDGKLGYTQTITYNADNSVTVEGVSNYEKSTENFVRNGDKITVGNKTLTINEDEYIAGEETEYYFYTLQYENGNLIERKYFYIDADGEAVESYGYDDKKSPFSNSNTPKWLLQHLLDFEYSNKNNALTFETEEGIRPIRAEYKYEYDSDGFPTKKTSQKICADDDECPPTITRFTYRGGTKSTSTETETAAGKTETAVSRSDTLVIGETAIVFITENIVSETADIDWCLSTTTEHYEKLGIKSTHINENDERYLSFSLGNGKSEVIDTRPLSSGAFLYKKGKKPISVDWCETMGELETALKYLQINLSEAKKMLGIVKLLESIVEEDGNGIVQKKFEYDEQNRLAKIYGKMYSVNYTQTITYNADNLVTVEGVFPNNKSTTKFVRKGNKITVEGETSLKIITIGGETLTVNKDGYIVKRERNSDGVMSYEYQYQDGNLIEDKSVRLESSSSDTYSYKYNYKKSPFSNSNTPKWLLAYLLSEGKNNVLEINFRGESGSRFTKCKYEYDEDEFPTKKTAESTNKKISDDPATYDTTITRYTYRSEK